MKVVIAESRTFYLDTRNAEHEFIIYHEQPTPSRAIFATNGDFSINPIEIMGVKKLNNQNFAVHYRNGKNAPCRINILICE